MIEPHPVMHVQMKHIQGKGRECNLFLLLIVLLCVSSPHAYKTYLRKCYEDN